MNSPIVSHDGKSGIYVTRIKNAVMESKKTQNYTAKLDPIFKIPKKSASNEAKVIKKQI